MNRFSRFIGRRQLAIAIAYCQTTTGLDDKVEQPIVVELNQIAEQMTHKYLLQQTCTISVNSSCQMITISLVALADSSQKYKNELFKVIDILENNFENKEWSVNELENILMEFRFDIANAKSFYLDSISAMDSALQLGQSSLNMSFTVEATTVFNCMSEKLYSAEKEFQSCIDDIRKVEEKFTKLLADTMKKTKNNST